jgi:hypothetical protein
VYMFLKETICLEETIKYIKKFNKNIKINYMYLY